MCINSYIHKSISVRYTHIISYLCTTWNATNNLICWLIGQDSPPLAEKDVKIWESWEKIIEANAQKKTSCFLGM